MAATRSTLSVGRSKGLSFASGFVKPKHFGLLSEILDCVMFIRCLWWRGGSNIASQLYFTVPRQKKQLEADVTKSDAPVFWNDNIPSGDSTPKFRKIISPAFPTVISLFFTNWSPLKMKVKHLAGVKRPGSEVDRSPPSGAEVKNKWSYSSTAPIRLRVVGGNLAPLFITYSIILTLEMLHNFHFLSPL